ncbi:hypothetical protein BV20DRAFT_994151 [Pilatotrama ljubarskyi]|nr:hypothetical protein BV20DRAFT_994151 [Pilatotrama ljubarskyi]
MDASLTLLSKEFGIQFSEKRKWQNIRGTVTRTWKSATKLANRPSNAEALPSPSVGQPPMQRWRLPLELLEQIIDHLYDDFPTLRSCALVCRALVSSVRHYLFHTILIKAKNFVDYVQLFVKNPHLTEHVRDLYFEADGNAFESLQALQQGKQPSKLLRVFALVIAPRLSNVVRLTMKDVPFDENIVAMFAPHFPRLHTLSLFDCWFRCNADLDLLVKNHPLIHTMRCGRLCSIRGVSDPTLPAQPGAKLTMRSLKVTEAYAPSPLTLMPWLVTHVNPETLIYTLYRLSQVAKLNHTIAGYPSLRHLHLILYHWRKSDTREVIECPETIALTPSYPPNIVTLTLDAKLHSLLLVVYMLAQLDPHSFVRLHTVNIIAHVLAEDVENVGLEAWAGMDKTLSVLLSLGAVHFTNSCNDPSHVEDGKAAIVARLPVLNVRNLLSFAAQKQGK